MTRCPAIALLLLLLPILALAATEPAAAQNTRIVRGQVLDENSKAFVGAIVRLKEKKSGKEISVTTGEEGRYQFNHVNMKTDYRIYALHEKKKSREKGVSSFDSRPLIRINLKLQPPEEEKKETEE